MHDINVQWVKVCFGQIRGKERWLRERERERETDRQTEGNINNNNRKKETTARIKQHAAARTRADCNQQPQQTHTIKKIFFHAPDEF